MARDAAEILVLHITTYVANGSGANQEEDKRIVSLNEVISPDSGERLLRKNNRVLYSPVSQDPLLFLVPSEKRNLQRKKEKAFFSIILNFASLRLLAYGMYSTNY